MKRIDSPELTDPARRLIEPLPKPNRDEQARRALWRVKKRELREYEDRLRALLAFEIVFAWVEVLALIIWYCER